MSAKFVNGDNLKRAVDYLQDGTIPIANENLAELFDNTKTYVQGDLLTYKGLLYVCLEESTGNLPTDTDYFEATSIAEILEIYAKINGNYKLMNTGSADVAKNLKAYSNSSGSTQEQPFISQGTGTNNNTEIVTTGDYCEIKSKNGNTIVVNNQVDFSSTTAGSSARQWYSFNIGNQTYSFSNNEVNVTAAASNFEAGQNLLQTTNHKYLIRIKAKVDVENKNGYIFIERYNNGGFTMVTSNINVTTTYKTFYTVLGYNDILMYAGVLVQKGTNTTLTLGAFDCIDLTQWFGGNDNIPADLLSNPSHFSWYYNGSLAYNTGELVNASGRYLECGQSRNLWDEEWEVGAINTSTGQNATSNDRIRSKDYIFVVPNTKCYFYNGSVAQQSNTLVFFYDKGKNFIGYEGCGNTNFTIPSNCQYIRFYTVAITYNHDITISLYYTPEQGGEGYDQYYPYVAPVIVDTGSEELLAFDKKYPSGVIENATEDIDLTTLTFTLHPSIPNWFYASLSGHARPDGSQLGVCNVYVTSSNPDFGQIEDYAIAFDGVDTSGRIIIKDSSCADATALMTKLTNLNATAQYKKLNTTNEQGTPFQANVDINDYSYMLWKDTNNNLVSVPQGNTIFYPVNYVGFIDDAYARTNGDASAIALESELTDSALNARGYYKMQDLSSGVTLATGVTAALKKAYKQGNVMTMSLILQNTSGAELSSYATLFTLASGMFPTNQYIVAYVEANNLLKRFRINPSGEGGIEYALPNNSVVYINISYAVA